MHKYLVLLFLVGTLKADGSSLYISPGIQLGVTSKTDFFLSAQITFGHVSYYGPPPYGVTIGLRKYRMQRKEWKEFVYTDFQVWPFFGGIGIGRMIDIKNEKQYTRFKTGIGAFGYATYDFCKDCGILKHNFGFIGAVPFYNIIRGDYNPL